MKIIVVANQKGGVGKTASVFHLAFGFQEKNKTVVVLDLDIQGNLSYSLKNFTNEIDSSEIFSSEISKINLKKKSINLIKSTPKLADLESKNIEEIFEVFSKNLTTIKEYGCDVCLIDTAPSLSTGLFVSMLCADFLISPIELEAYSILGINKMLQLFNKTKMTNKKIVFLGMLASRLDRRNPKQLKNLKDLENEYKDFLIPFHIGLRTSVSDALVAGIPVWKIKKTSSKKAAEEMTNFVNFIYEKTYKNKK